MLFSQVYFVLKCEFMLKNYRGLHILHLKLDIIRNQNGSDLNGTPFSPQK